MFNFEYELSVYIDTKYYKRFLKVKDDTTNDFIGVNGVNYDSSKKHDLRTF